MKHLKTTFFLAGTAIGSGLISLPVILAAWGTIGAIMLIVFFAIVTYLSALARCELNVQSKATYTLKQVCISFSGQKMALLGDLSIKLLCFTLLTAYLHGLNTLLATNLFAKILIIGLFLILLLLPTNITLNFNKLCFYLLLFLIINVIFSFVVQINLSMLPEFALKKLEMFELTIPTLFTAFGFQGSLHSLTKLCDNDPMLIRKACFFGCFITAGIYILWTLGLTTFLSQNMPEQFSEILINSNKGLSVIGRLMECKNFEISCITGLTIITSIIGVGISLMDDIEENFRTKLNFSLKRLLCASIIVVPTAILANTCAQAFIKILSLAGCILAIIAIFIPLFLLKKTKKPFVFYELNSKLCNPVLFLFGVLVILCEMHIL